ncbi:ankyrin repeat and BTB/POZ domain-containing protein 1 isoform X2 [Bos indicus x Bos taurus]|uniref:Ankyrin repeat and BTB/POZ domain-containing protein 1 n=1 Tax=Bos taurus TaxID=9913 RepID=A4FV83_BOVIN|nr:ankyrin repeat and BTB/POZ domain-containing protein 1 [Bos taurus]XP_027379688.1 ankyrin repeat and BTB/POZ domain-containing protein 1 isoform X2 [Bos indicus x Bos taurus]AAI23852.1 ABTB1 protein [Bos taurus]DAA16735.1 TPA: ankyrin repeat and BTB (POZ) domain containing 1 [Bos taurus]
MDTCDLFSSCRKGDVGRVRYLLEQRDVEVNVRDKWDSTPLYYACLCGHEELVLYLLAHGARCEANTFDGERCLYGAQSDAIRRALRDYRQVTASFWRRDLYYSFLLRLLEQGLHSDVVFVVHGRAFRAHRGVLGARSTYFAHMLDTKWKGRSAVVLRHPLINPVAFGALLQYLYTGCLDVGVEHVSDCERLARQCQLWGLLGGLEAKQASKPGVCMKVLTIEPPQADLQLREDLALLADCALPPELRGDLGELPFPCDGLSSCPDVCFRVGGYDFLCHKAFFCGRSEYFRALLDDHFQESEQLEASGGLPAVTLHSVSPEVFTHVLYYVYSDHTELPPELAYDVLSVADMYLLPGLKQLCGRSLAQLLDEDSVVGVWRVAKLFGLARLEDQCTKYMARVIEKLVQQEDFVEAVREEAAAVAGRQETDSIPLVDDIRFHMGSLVQTCHAMEQAAQRLRVLEELLVSIGLDC